MRVTRILILGVAIGLCTTAIAQELITNGGLQLGTKSGGCFTAHDDNGFDEFTPTNWTFAVDDPNCNVIKPGGLLIDACTSPDWLDESTCFTNFKMTENTSIDIPTSTAAGNRFIGLYRYADGTSDRIEGVRTTLSEPLRAGHFYELSITMAVDTQQALTTDAKLEVSFARWGEHWASSNSGNLLWEDITDKFTIPFNSGAWHKITHKFKVPNEINGEDPDLLPMGNLILRIHDNNNEFRYIFLDDISLIHIDPCDAFCVSDSAHATVRLPAPPATTIPLGNRPDPSTLTSWKTTVQNATEVMFQVWDQWGGLQYEHYEYDPNVLLDPGFNDYQVEWTGTNNSGNHIYGEGFTHVYTCRITAQNCASGKVIENFNVTFEHLNDSNVHIPDVKTIRVDSIAHCCPEFLVVDNFTYTSDVREVRDKYIRSAQLGNVTVSAASKVEYVAGDEITIGPFFNVAPGGEFTAIITPCVAASRTFGKYKPRKKRGFVDEYYSPINVDYEQKLVGNFAIFPNPTLEQLSIIPPTLLPSGSFQVFSSAGGVVSLGTYEGLFDLDVSDLVAGLYFIKIGTDVKRFIKL